VSNNFEEIKFAHSFDSEFKEKVEAPLVVMFKNFDEMRNDFDLEFTLENLEEFIDINSMKSILKFDEKTAEMIFSNSRDSLFCIYGDDLLMAATYIDVL